MGVGGKMAAVCPTLRERIPNTISLSAAMLRCNHDLATSYTIVAVGGNNGVPTGNDFSYTVRLL